MVRFDMGLRINSMKKLIFFLIFLAGCNSNTSKEFMNTNLKNVSVYEYLYSKDGIYNSGIPTKKICVLTNLDSINVLLSALNSKKPEFCIFMPEYNIELNYADTTIEIGVSQKFIKIDGRPFKIMRNLSNYLASMKKH